MLKKLLAVVLMLCATMAMAAVDVNKATEAELDSIKGIGPSTSKTIISERKKSEFKSWEDFITRVKGVGEDKAAKFSAEGLTVNGTAYRKAADKPAATAKPAASSAKPAASAKK
jgi:competence protein ComEA